MATNRIEGDLQVTGRIIAGTLTVPAGAVANAGVAADAAIVATKMFHRFHPVYQQAGTVATATASIYKAIAAGEVLAVWAGSIAIAVGAATVTVDFKKNGTTILSAVITLDTGNTARVAEAGTLSGTITYAAGDWFEVVVTATAGGGTLPTGFACGMQVNEAAA